MFMAGNRNKMAGHRTRVVVLTADSAFEQSVSATFAASPQIDLTVVAGTLAMNEGAFDLDESTIFIIDIDAGQQDEMDALARLMAEIAGRPPVVVVTQSFDAAVARQLLQMRVADFMVKPVVPADLARTCARVVVDRNETEQAEAEIYTFLPAVGGAGVTTLSIQTALLLLSSGQKTRTSTCLVDLDFQHGACADYLDLEPRLDLKEIEPRPERLDRQLLEVMLSYHACGLAVIAAPNRPAEMRSFDPDMVTRLLDLVSSHFNYVVIDMPRTWFSWTDSVLLGSNKLFIVSEMTVPGLRQAKHLVAAIRERLSEAPAPKVVINRFEQRAFGAGLRKADIEHVLGNDFAGVVPNDYRLVREAIDRGVPLEEIKAGNKITMQLKKLITPQLEKPAGGAALDLVKKLSFSWAK
jgi:pilus assembly protein CpaE